MCVYLRLVKECSVTLSHLLVICRSWHLCVTLILTIILMSVQSWHHCISLAVDNHTIEDVLGSWLYRKTVVIFFSFQRGGTVYQMTWYPTRCLKLDLSDFFFVKSIFLCKFSPHIFPLDSKVSPKHLHFLFKTRDNNLSTIVQVCLQLRIMCCRWGL